MNVTKFKDWNEFKQLCERYARMKLPRRSQWVFRGQGSNLWSLETSLDRFARERHLNDRDAALDVLMREFMRGSNGLAVAPSQLAARTDWELLARHHGLPTPYLDWTQSPYVAAFFAFADPEAIVSEFVSVWVLERDVFAQKPTAEIEVIDDHEALRFNSRANEQRGLFLRVNSTGSTVENLLSSHLYRLDLPSNIRLIALRDLDSMMINDRTLFRDLDGAARMATARLSLERYMSNLSQTNLFGEAAPLPNEDEQLIAVYRDVGIPVDRLMTSGTSHAFVSKLHGLGDTRSREQLLQRLLTLRKAGRLPRIAGLADASPATGSTIDSNQDVLRQVHINDLDDVISRVIKDGATSIQIDIAPDGNSTIFYRRKSG